ncbi:hypothetical protein BO219_13530 [Anoxybacillus kestanbolensis]|uniref:Glycosyltransferase subfamily 4-like N-terminal domain-containing protein n=1 Tax=Anoxybacillus kestanbolensis TaxID=227476 RepID=A0A1V3FEZ2_9BACL|nr:glycosyltransferase [Anoxybacillus kestanbolensis]OOE00228.1 hypothetical protein BO219_13530 [Anoxybacillus kestanbolensis]
MNLLIITNNFPPCNVSASIRSLNYANYLAKHGHHVTVIAADYPKDFINYDESLQERISEEVSLIYADMGMFYKKFYTKKINLVNESIDQSGQAKVSCITNFLKKYLKDYIVIPDSYVFWKWNATKKAIEIMKNNKIDIVLSMHESPSAHLVGYRLKKMFPNVKWVTYWSDPWTIDPLRKGQPLIRRKIEEYLEKKVVEKADKFLFTSRATEKLYIKKYGISENKTAIVYRGYDYVEKLGDIPEGIDLKKLNIVYTGEIFSKLRDLYPICSALDYLELKEKELYSSINFVFLGNIDSNSIKERLSKHKNVKLLPRVSFDRAQQYCAYADVLLLIGNKNSDQIPGKAYDYFGFNAPILTIYSSDDDPMVNLMKEVNKGPIIKNDSKYIVEILKRLAKRNYDKSWTKIVEKYSWELVVQDLSEKIKD